MKENKFIILYTLFSIGLLISMGVATKTVFDNTRYFELNGSSMKPTIQSGQLVRCVESFESISEGDVIAFNHPYKNYTVIHRVTTDYNDKFKTKGDNNPTADNYLVTEDMVICKARL